MLFGFSCATLISVIQMITDQTLKKLTILSDAAKYDTTCASGYSRTFGDRSVGNYTSSGICHSYTADGRCISLLKVLYTNKCIYNCAYCVNKVTNNCLRESFTSEELAALTYEFYRRNYISGLFLSSAIENTPTQTQQNIYRTLYLLRKKYAFKGYIHAKALPGADLSLIEACGYLADRMSVNIELATRENLRMLAPQKSFESIAAPMQLLHHRLQSSLPSYDKSNRPAFLPAGQSTQMIVGLGNESDYQILRTAKYLYQSLGLSRITYSAYIPVNENSLLPALNAPIPLKRENRLFQADWLMRYYFFDADELLNAQEPFFDLGIDPKTDWALRNYDLFPVEISKASYTTLLRIPGIGRRSAARIIHFRKEGTLTFDTLKRMGVVLKRARYFIVLYGQRMPYSDFYAEDLRFILRDSSAQQLSFFPMQKGVPHVYHL